MRGSGSVTVELVVGRAGVRVGGTAVDPAGEGDATRRLGCPGRKAGLAADRTGRAGYAQKSASASIGPR